jgi:hypothetical protein
MSIKQSNNHNVIGIILRTITFATFVSAIAIISTPSQGKQPKGTDEVTSTPSEGKHPKGAKEVTPSEGKHPKGAKEVTPSEGKHPKGAKEVTPSEGKHPKGAKEVTPSEGKHPKGAKEVTPSEGKHPKGTKEVTPPTKEAPPTESAQPKKSTGSSLLGSIFAGHLNLNQDQKTLVAEIQNIKSSGDIEKAVGEIRKAKPDIPDSTARNFVSAILNSPDENKVFQFIIARKNGKTIEEANKDVGLSVSHANAISAFISHFNLNGEQIQEVQKALHP